MSGTENQPAAPANPEANERSQNAWAATGAANDIAMAAMGAHRDAAKAHRDAKEMYPDGHPHGMSHEMQATDHEAKADCIKRDCFGK